MTKLNYSVFRSALLFSALLGGTAYAGEIGTVDVMKVVNSANATVSLQKKIEELSNKLRDEAQSEQAAMKIERDALESKSSKLPTAEAEKKQKEFAAKIASAQQKYGERNEQLRKKFDDASKKTQDELEKIYKKVAADKGLSLLVTKTAVLYAGDGIDVTEEVLKEFNKAVPNIDVTH